jgi:hypothetical protein
MKPLHFEHIRCPLHYFTFSVKAIRHWVEQTCEGRVLNLFAGNTKLAVDETRNDPDPDMWADFHMYALAWQHGWSVEKFNTVLFEPPYAFRKPMELYKRLINRWLRQLKDALTDCLQPGGLVITFGYHSVVMGRNRNFGPERLALFSHVGAIHDTIASAEHYAPP